MEIPEPLIRAWLCMTRALHPGAGRSRDERGDVPGWVMITVMTAALVAAILTFAQAELVSMVKAALNRVSP